MVIVSISLGISAFTSLKMFPILMEALELYGCMMIYGSGCIAGAIFVLFVLKETSGQSLDDVESDEKTDDILLTNSESQRPLNPSNQNAFRYHTFSNHNKQII